MIEARNALLRDHVEMTPGGIILLEYGHLFLHNVKEHATLSARARVDHGVGVKTTEDHVNRAADRGCCVSTCSAIFSAMSTGPVSTPWKNH
jgi:hypothetical protein